MLMIVSQSLAGFCMLKRISYTVYSIYLNKFMYMLLIYIIFLVSGLTLSIYIIQLFGL